MREYKIGEIADVTEALQLVSNVPAWKERLQEMKALQDELKKLIATKKHYDNLAVAVAKATTEAERAEALRKEGEANLKQAKVEAEQIVANAKVAAKTMADKAKVQHNKLSKWETELNERKTVLDILEKDIREQVAKFEKDSIELKKSQIEADKLQKSLKDKALRIRQVAGD